MAIASMLAFISNWSTPTILFCVLNLMIATIFIASKFKSPNHDHHNTPSQLTRSPSLLERVKSVNLSSFYASPDSHDQYGNSASQLSPPLSLLQRVKSIDFSFSSFQNSSSTESERLGNSQSDERTQTPSLLDRVKSFKLSPPLNSDQQSGNMASGKDEDSHVSPRHDSVEDKELANLSEKSSATLTNRSPNKLMKSSREKATTTPSNGDEKQDNRQRRVTKKAVITRAVHDESVDAKADDFIKRFKHQLKLQRLDSLQRLREMLNRGTSSSSSYA